MRSLKVRSDLIEYVKRRAINKGYTRQIDLAEAIGCSQSTAYSFLNGKPVDNLNFREFCNILDLDFKDIADFGVSTKENEEEENPPEILEIDKMKPPLNLEYPEGAVPVDSS